MKKTTKSPESTEVTPSKKKLKQARLPFMLISDVSPKAETPPSRKRKLSVPDPEPVTKVGKISKENNISEDLVVISDEDSKGFPSPGKDDKPLNPFVKLVDTAMKKKLQKKDSKKTKTRSSKRQKSAKQSSVDSGDNNDVDDVEMVAVDVIIHEDGEENNSEKSANASGLNNNKSPDKKNTEPQNKKVPKSVSPKTTSEKTDKKTSGVCLVFPKENNTEPKKESDIVCLDESNDPSDVVLPQPNDPSDTKPSSDSDKNESATKTKAKPKRKMATPKRSARTAKMLEAKKSVEKSETQGTESLNSATSDTEEKSPVKDASQPTKTTTNIESNNQSQSDHSDVEMVDIPEEKEVANEDSDIEESENVDNSTEAPKSPSSDVPTTPKRSTRNKTKTEEASKLDESSASLLDESMTSNPSTPKHNKSLSDGQADKSLNDSTRSANLTPKQLQRKMEFAKKREEKEKEKQEREMKRQQEKEERAKQRLEKEEQKKKEREEKEEAKRKEREEKEEQKKKERDEKEKQKESERKAREMKEEQKRKEKEDKEEQRRKEKEAREEERRKKQEAMELEKQEQELKKKKAAEAFVNFFVPKQKVERESSTGPISKNSMLSSFTIKSDMRLAPTCRVDLSEEKREVLDRSLEEQDPEDELYLKCLKNGSAKPLGSGKTWPLEDKDNDVMIVEDELPPIDEAGEVITCESAPRETLRPKLFSFHENRRPPYWGTWRKKSVFVKPRRPFGQDEKQLEYEIDSDDDWEDEQDGESLDGSAGGSDDEAGADDYEVDNEVFVPHGYLSDEEATMDEEDDVLSLSPDTQKARLKHLEDEFESELKKPTEKLKPRLYGLLWEDSEGMKPEKCVDALWNYFQKFAMIMNDPTPLLQPTVESESSVSDKKKVKKKKVAEGEVEKSPKSEKKKKQKPESKESKKPKPEVKKPVPNQPGINSFLKRVQPTKIL